MANKNNNPGRAAANLLLFPAGLQQILRLKTFEERGRVITAAAEYFMSDYKTEPNIEGALCEFVFAGIKDDLDRNEKHCAETKEKNRDGGRTTQRRRREALQATRTEKDPPQPRTDSLPECTLANLRAYGTDHGMDDEAAKEAAKSFWDYNAGIGNIEKAESGEYKLTADAKGRPLYDWHKAFIGFVNSQYDRTEWEQAHDIDPRTHKPRKK